MDTPRRGYGMRSSSPLQSPPSRAGTGATPRSHAQPSPSSFSPRASTYPSQAHQQQQPQQYPHQQPHHQQPQPQQPFRSTPGSHAMPQSSPKPGVAHPSTSDSTLSVTVVPLEGPQGVPLIDITQGVLQVDPYQPLTFSLPGSMGGVRIRVGTPSGGVHEFDVPGASAPSSSSSSRGAGAPSSRGAGGGGSSSSTGGGLSSFLRGFGVPLGGASPAHKGGSLVPLRCEVSVDPVHRRLVVRCGEDEGGGAGDVGSGWVPSHFHSTLYGTASREEERRVKEHAQTQHSLGELGEAMDKYCDKSRCAPMLALLACARGNLRWETRRLMVRRKALLDDLKGVMNALSSGLGGRGEGKEVEEEEGEEEAKPLDPTTVSATEGLLRRVAHLRDSIGELSLKLSPVQPTEQQGGGSSGDADLPSVYASTLTLASSHSAGEQEREEREARELAGDRRAGSGGGSVGKFNLALLTPGSPMVEMVVGALAAECARMHSAARCAAGEKKRCLEAHFAATTPMSELAKLPDWVRRTVANTGLVVAAELKAIELCKEDGTSLL